MFYLVFEICFWCFVLEKHSPLWITLSKIITWTCASCWLQAKLTWMQRTGVHLYLNLLLIVCSVILMYATHPPACRMGRTPLSWAIQYCQRNNTAVCELLIAGKADVNAKNECAFVLPNIVFQWVFEIFCWFSVLVNIAKTPLCITLPVTVARQCASCWLQAKLTWMQRTGARLFKIRYRILSCILFLNFASDFLF